MDAQEKSWCEKDKHHLYAYHADFNDWLENDEAGQLLLEQYGLANLSQPSKAFFASDKAEYDQAFVQYRQDRLHEALSQTYLSELSGDLHWFERNLQHFEQLLQRLEQKEVVPFVGAGISVAGGFPTWHGHLRQQAKNANLNSAHIEALLEKGQFEAVIAEIEARHSRALFVQEIRDVFKCTGSIPDVVLRLTELFDDTLLTTNYDRLLEQAYDTGEKDAVQVINGLSGLEPRQSAKVTVVKLHGDINQPGRCVLSKNQYDQAYGEDGLDLTQPIPKLLAYHFQTSSLLFLGCSLHNDRTVQVFRTVKQQAGDTELPQHFSFEQVPDDLEELAQRNNYLAELGITAIWFEKERFEYIESLLSLARDELRYRSMTKLDGADDNNVQSEQAVLTNIELSHFLNDFVDLMPLLYWLHRPVPQAETSKYLLAMQHVFYADSLFTEQTDQGLVSGLDLVLRTLSNNPHFDGYSYGKLSEAFSLFQHYLQVLGKNNYSKEKYDWNYRELLSIPLHQFENLLATSSIESKSDYYAVRLIVALLNHGLKQQHSPKRFCELPAAVNMEFGDYLSWSLSCKLGLLTPDRLDEMLTSDINGLCKNAWDNFDQPPDLQLLDKVKLMFSGRLKLAN
jgi:NAD-dependent SIR2 family protein deacetylase